MSSNTVKAAWIGAGGAVLAALLTVALNVKSKTAPRDISGEVHDTNGFPLANARIVTALDQHVPESTFSDENGVFHVVLKDDVHTVKMSVSLQHYVSVTRDVNPLRTGPEEFSLERIAVDSQQKLHQRSGHNYGTFETKGNHSPIIIGNGNSVSGSDAPR